MLISIDTAMIIRTSEPISIMLVESICVTSQIKKDIEIIVPIQESIFFDPIM